MMKFMTVLSLTFACATASAADTQLYARPANHRISQTINRSWTFNYFPSEDAASAGCEQAGFDDSTWPAIAIPHTWQTYETTGKIHPYIYDAAENSDLYWWAGWGWYRKHFSISKDQADRKVFVEFDGVQKYCKVFVNGKLLGDHKGGYGGFDFDITNLLRFGEDNVLAVAVNNRQNDPHKIPPMNAGNYDVYGGIYRDARIVIKDKLYIPYQGTDRHQGGTFVTTPKVQDASGTVRVRTWVQNDYPESRECQLHTTIADADGKVIALLSEHRQIPAGQMLEFDQTSEPIDHPHLWSPDHPYVYTVHSDVFDSSGNAVDHFDSPLGFRSFKWDYDTNRLILNGKPIVLRGINRHQEYPWLGDATPKWLHLLDMHDLRDNLNINFMRTAHYPHDSAIYDFTDRHGVIVIEELPNIKRIAFDAAVQRQMLHDAIRRDRNHPSIFFWSMGNETDHAVDSKYAIEEDNTRLIHARDVYNDSAGKFVNTTSKNLPLESLLRCTIRGWYNKDVRDLEPDSAQQAGTETWQHDLAAAELIQRNKGRTPETRANLSCWLYADHGCDRQYANEPVLNINPKGWVDSWRVPKYMYYLWQAFYAEKPMVFVEPHFWREQYLGQKKEIVVDSNCDLVELKVNGRSIGTAKPRFEQANVVRFKDVTIERGTLTAEGRKGDQVVTTNVVMAGPAARLTLTSNPSTLEAGMDSVAIIRADIVDADGNHVYGATNTIQWDVSGPAKLVGPNVYVSDIDKHESPGGTMYIDAPTFNIIRSSGKPGVIRVRALSPGLASAEIRLTASDPSASQSPILQPPLPDGDRHPVARESGAPRRPEVVQEIRGISEDLQIKGADSQDCLQQIDRFLRSSNPSVDFDRPEYRALADVFSRALANNHGSLVRDDFNFTVNAYNNCRHITRQVDQLALPDRYKQSLDAYYARAMIVQGETKDLDAETRWLRSLPEGELVMIDANNRDLQKIVLAARPEIGHLDDHSRQLVLDAVAKLNPCIKRHALRTGGEKVNGVRQSSVETVTYELKDGEPVLIPGMDYLSQRIRTASGK